MDSATLDEGKALLAAWNAADDYAVGLMSKLALDHWLRTHAAVLIASARQAQDNAKVLAALVELVAWVDRTQVPLLVTPAGLTLSTSYVDNGALDNARAAIAAATPGKGDHPAGLAASGHEPYR